MTPPRYIVRHWLKKYRRWILIRQCGLVCFYCHVKLSRIQGHDRSVTLDHLVPRCQNGSDRISNLVLACGPCNRRKGDMSVAQYFESPRLAARITHISNEPGFQG